MYHACVVHHQDMNTAKAIDEINRLLDDPSEETVNTSMRLPACLRDAAALAVDHLDVAASTTALTAAALRHTLETTVMEAALRLHYRKHPGARPSLAEVALALAAQQGSPLAGKTREVQKAAIEVSARYPHADAFDVLLWAEARRLTVA